MPEKKKYVGIKIVEAWPEMQDGVLGYIVEYEDGYISWSPKGTFEKAYQEIEAGMCFLEALYPLKLGRRIARKEWAESQYIHCTVESGLRLMRDGIDVALGSVVESDLMAEDWIVVFNGPESLTGEFAKVIITRTSPLTLFGELTGSDA